MSFRNVHVILNLIQNLSLFLRPLHVILNLIQDPRPYFYTSSSDLIQDLSLTPTVCYTPTI